MMLLSLSKWGSSRAGSAAGERLFRVLRAEDSFLEPRMEEVRCRRVVFIVGFLGEMLEEVGVEIGLGSGMSGCLEGTSLFASMVAAKAERLDAASESVTETEYVGLSLLPSAASLPPGP